MPSDWKANPPMNPIKHERFLRIAEKRTNQVVLDLMKLGKCSSKASYDYTEAEIAEIMGEIEREVDRLRERFVGKKTFSLSDPIQTEE